uniref:Uncharacterized protein n=1 Tax=Macaca fascicularis TaxID=9541 RepID=Q95K59_MACFA|nr:hypothetical protein [Macaca fascicularis]
MSGRAEPAVQVDLTFKPVLIIAPTSPTLRVALPQCPVCWNCSLLEPWPLGHGGALHRSWDSTKILQGCIYSNSKVWVLGVKESMAGEGKGTGHDPCLPSRMQAARAGPFLLYLLLP